jgi:uncharacterized protein YdeI (BOF family)
MLKKLTVLSTTAMLAVSTQSIADSNDLSVSINTNSDSVIIENLPDQGDITISGTVERVIDQNKMIISDRTGDTIDVNTNQPIDIKMGETVTVKGNLDSEIAGIGKQIVDATITEIGLDLDSTAGSDVSLSADMGSYGDESKDSPIETMEISKIQNMPEQGMVEISGTVASVQGDGSFILKDNVGQKVEVDLVRNEDLSKGDKVAVTGQVMSNSLNGKAEIRAKDVSKLSYYY